MKNQNLINISVVVLLINCNYSINKSVFFNKDYTYKHELYIFSNF